MGLTFLGHWECKLDGKRRLTVPADLRDELDEAGKLQLVTTIGKGGGLDVYPQQLWDHMIKDLMQSAANGDEEADMLRNIFALYGSRGKLDATGRLSLTEDQLELAGIKKQAIVFGNITHIEIWAPEQFELNKPSTDDIAEQKALIAKYRGQAETRG